MPERARTNARRRVAALTACLLGLGAVWAPAAAADAEPGDLDQSFGNAGKVTTNFSSGSDFASAIAIRQNRIVAAGKTATGGGNFALAIYNLDGSLRFDKVDTGFGGSESARGVAFTPSGGIVAAGSTSNLPKGENARFALAGYFGFGALNPNFGSDGRVTTTFNDGAIAFANAVAVQADGRIVAAGGNNDFALARYNPDGALDRSFDGDGKVVTGFGDSFERADAVAIQTDGKIVVAGDARSQFALARYNPDGSLDSSFDGDGKVLTDFSSGFDGAVAVAIQTNGKIVAAGRTGSGRFALARYNLDGSLDSSFGGDGRVTTEFSTGTDSARGVAIQSDGKIVAAGLSDESPARFALARYLPDGSLDRGFGDAGRVRTDFSGAAAFGAGVAIGADGKIVVAGGTAFGSGRFALARYHAEAFDDTPPNTSLSGPEGTINDPSPTFSFTSSEAGSSFACSLDGGPFEACTSPRTLGPLGDGEHRFAVQATDAADNSDPTPAQRSFTVDTTPPQTVIDSGPPAVTNDPTPTFSFSSSEAGSSFACSLDGGAFEACTSPRTVGPLGDGEHRFAVRATDAAANTDPTPAQRSFTIDTTPPPPPPGTPAPPPPGGGTPPPDTSPPPPVLAPPFAAKLEVQRARVLRADRELDVLAPITARASGVLDVKFRAARRTERFDAPIDAQNRRARFRERIPASQARLGTGILTLTYPGDADTQPQEVRLRAASQKANLDANRPRIEDGRLKATGTITTRARGVVRLQLLFEPPGQPTRTLEFKAPINNGRYRFDEKLTDAQQQQIAQRRGVVHTYTLFTGHFERRIRGEMQSFQVLPAP